MSEEDGGSPLRSIFCLKSREKMREVEEREDCFILEFDPYDKSNLAVSISPVDSSSDLLIAEKGQVSEEDEGSPLRSIFCLKSREKMREVEEREDCFILEFDPYDNSNLSVSISPVDSSSDLLIIAEKGQVACRDYPHSRHVCIKYPFEKTPHENCCKLCYCFVCDVAAPCRKWTGTSGHCNATDSEDWKFERNKVKEEMELLQGKVR